jgi:hypothetical protein
MKRLLRNLRLLRATIASAFLGRDHHRPVSFHNIQTLLLHLCDYDEAACHWVMCWLAYPLRNPGAKMAMGIVVNGEGGTGKSVFFHHVAAGLYRDDSARVINARQLHDVFTRWADGAGLVVVDGTFSKKNATRLKSLISAVSVPITTKGRRDRTIDNRMNFVFLSTSTEFLPVLETDRRLFVLEVPPRHTDLFYRAVMYEIQDGGLEAFRDYLLHGLDMGSFNETTRPPAAPAQHALREVA